jgi:hypothetical protein
MTARSSFLASAGSIALVLVVAACVADAPKASTSPSSISATIASSSPSPEPTPTDTLPVIVAEDPEAEIVARISVVGQCQRAAVHDFLMDRREAWDDQIDDSGIDHGWLVGHDLWVGDDLPEVVRVFGGTVGAISSDPPKRGPREMWIVTEHDGRPMAQQLIPWETPKGRTVWHRWNTVTVVPCPSDGV